jgi:SNF2 family DNA or RNA helicase
VIDIVKTKKKSLSKSNLRNMKMIHLCKLANIKYVECPETIKKKITKKKQDQLSFQPQNQNLSCILRSVLTLQPQQIKIIQYLQNHRGILIYHSVGSGKTLTAITASQCYLDQNPDRYVIVIAPASLIENFKTQMSDYKNILYSSQYKFFSIQGFVNAYIRKEIDCKNSLLIIDEAHNLKTSFKESKSKGTKIGIRSKYVIECAQKADKVILLSATPITNSPKDLIPLYNMIRDKHEPFMKISKKDLDGLKQTKYTEQNLIRLLKCKISFFNAIDRFYYPKQNNENVYIEMTPSYEKKYDELLQGQKGLSDLAISHFGEINIEKFYNGYRRAVNNLEDENSPKIKWVLNKLKENEKTIIFSHFLDSGNLVIINHLPEYLKKQYGYIRGNTPKKIRAELVKKYNENKIKILFISKAGGEGLNLKGTRNIIILEPSWNKSNEEQIIGRGIRYKSHIHLPEKERFVNVYHLYLVKPSDKKYLKTNENDQDIMMNHKTNSIDLFMKFLAERKERLLQKFRKDIKNISIQKFSCD